MTAVMEVDKSPVKAGEDRDEGLDLPRRNVPAGRTLRILVTGGGTGGHTTPAVAVIQAIRTLAESEGWSAEFVYLGSKHGVERKVAEELGVTFAGIETGKLRRARSAIGMLSLANLRDALRVPVGYGQALGAVRRFRPNVVFSTGGYVSVPGVLAAAALGVPVVAHEQTVQVGLANRINFRFARVIALSAAEALPGSRDRRVIVTGNPVRDIVFGGDASRAARQFGFDPKDDDLPTVYVTGGAQGSRAINRAVEACLPDLLKLGRVVHQCGVQPDGGEQDFDRLTAARERLPESLEARYAVVKYVGPEIGDVYALADLVIGRSGAGTVTEACALGKAAIFVPLVPTGGDEQTRNAQCLVDVGAAKIVKQSDLSGKTLLAAAAEMLEGRTKLKEMGQRALTLATPNAARKLAEVVVGLAIGKRA